MTLTDLKNRKLERGFTIVELLIVIVVIAILAALVLTAYNGVQARARDSARQSDVRSIATRAEALASENSGAYPDYSTMTGNTGTVKIDSSVVGKMSNTVNPSSSSANWGTYTYILCSGSQGAKIYWYKEETSALQTRNLGTATGSTFAATC